MENHHFLWVHGLSEKIIRKWLSQLRVLRKCRGQVSLGLTEWRRDPNEGQEA